MEAVYKTLIQVINIKGNNLPADLNTIAQTGVKPLLAFLAKRKDDRMFEKNKRDKIKDINSRK